MKNTEPVRRIDGVLIRGLEEVLDSANLMSLDLAVQAFEMEEFVDSRSWNCERLINEAERGLTATGMIAQMMADLRIAQIQKMINGKKGEENAQRIDRR